jgi:formate hydrogenlyase subunit 4
MPSSPKRWFFNRTQTLWLAATWCLALAVGILLALSFPQAAGLLGFAALALCTVLLGLSVWTRERTAR